MECVTETEPMGVMTTVRCQTCAREQVIVGPTYVAIMAEPGWRIDVNNFYLPNGRHYCPEHRWATYVAWCDDTECMTEPGTDRVVKAPPFMGTSELLDQLAPYSCPDGHDLIAVERMPDEMDGDIEL